MQLQVAVNVNNWRCGNFLKCYYFELSTGKKTDLFQVRDLHTEVQIVSEAGKELPSRFGDQQ